MTGEWTKSSASGANGCAEVRLDRGHVQVRHSQDPDVALTFTEAEWTALLAGVKAGEFDLP